MKDLSGIDFGGVDFSGTETSEISGVDFGGIDFGGVDLPEEQMQPENYDSIGSASLKAVQNVPEGWQQQYGGLAKMLGEDMGQDLERNFAITAHRVSQNEGFDVSPQHIKGIYLANKQGLLDPSAPFSEHYSLADQLVQMGSVDDSAVQSQMPVSPEGITDYGQGIIDKAESEKEAIDVEPHSPAYYASAITGSLGNMAPALLAGIATRNPNITMGMIGPQVTGQAYEDARSDGASIDDAQLYAVASAAAEAIPEKMALDQILKAGGGLFRKVVTGAAAEGLQEMVTESINIGLDKGVLDKDMTWGEASMRLVDAGIIGTGSGAAIGTVAEGADKLTNNDSKNAEQAMYDSETGVDANAEAIQALDPSRGQQVPQKPLEEIDFTGIDAISQPETGYNMAVESSEQQSILDEISALENIVASDQAEAEQKRKTEEDAAWSDYRAQETGALTTAESKAAGESEVAWRERQQIANQEGYRPNDYDYEADAGKAAVGYLSKKLDGKADNLRTKLEQRRQPPENTAMATALGGAMEQAGTSAKDIGDKTFANMLVRRQHDNVQHLKPAIKRPDLNRIIPERDELMTAVRKLGGLNVDEAKAQGIDPQHIKDKVGRNNPFRRDGRSLDDLAESLQQYGYNTPDANALLNMVDESLRGNAQFTPEGAITNAERIERDNAALRALDDNDPTPVSSGYDASVESYPEVSEQDKVLAHLVDRALDEGVDPQLIDALKSENLNHSKAAGKLLALTYEAQQNGRQTGELGSRQGAHSGDSTQAREGQIPFQEQDAGYSEGPDLAEFFGLNQEVGDTADNESFSLEQQTEESLAAAARQKSPDLQAVAEQKAQVDREREHFALTGSSDTNTSVSASNDAAQAQPAGDMFTSTREATHSKSDIGGGSSHAPAAADQADIDRKANEAATSPLNESPLPTEAQKAAGNYRKGRIEIRGLKIAIENPKGSVRSGTDPEGGRWENKIHYHYGDLTGTKGADGDALDVFIGEDLESDKVFIIDQVDKNGTFDEHKIMLGFGNKLKARQGYLKNYDSGWKVGPITTMTMDEFKGWLKGDTTGPLNAKLRNQPKPVKAAPVDNASTPSPQDKTLEIDDYGQVLEGAKKHIARSTKDRLDKMDDGDIASSTLGKMWPKSEVDAIEDSKVAALYHSIREEIPNKPRAPYKIKRWVESVKTVRALVDMTEEIGPIALPDRMRDKNSSLSHLADRVDLLAGIDRAHWNRIGKIRKASGRYRNDDGEMVPGSWFDIEIDGRRKSFYDADSISSIADEVKSQLGDKVATTKKIKMAIYSRGRNTGAFIAADSDKLKRPLKEFDSLTAARDFLANPEGQAELEQAWSAVKERDNVTRKDIRGSKNSTRSGKDRRNGRDVTPEEFSEAFGFRGIQFGNWVKQGKGGKDRQGMLNQAFDALHDLAEIVGIPPKAISLNGELGLAFGARGSGKAAAHYEAGQLVINLTKTQGAGSLAHEWFHALDHYFQRMRGTGRNDPNSGPFITFQPENYYRNKTNGLQIPAAEFESMSNGGEGKSGRRFVMSRFNPNEWEKIEGVRPEVADAFAAVVEALNESPMHKRARLIDAGKKDGYWSRIIERAARSFESYVIAKMAESGQKNDYLANVTSIENFIRNPDRYPYLLADEMAPVANAFDRLFETIETRETDTGVALYNLGIGKGVSVSQVKMSVMRLAKEVGVPIEVVATDADLPRSNYDEIRADGVEGRVRGLYNTKTGKAYIVAGNLDNVSDAAEVYLHEVVGHKGIRAATGNRLNLVLSQIYSNMPTATRRLLEEKYANQLSGKQEAERRRIVADEYVAHVAETDPKSSVLKRVISVVRDWLRKVVPSLKWTEEDIASLLAKGKKKLLAGESGAESSIDNESANELIDMLRSLDRPDVNEILEKQGLASLKGKDYDNENGGNYGRERPGRNTGESPDGKADPYQEFYSEIEADTTEASAPGAGEIERLRAGENVTLIHRSHQPIDRFDNASTGANTGTGTALLGHWLAVNDVGNAERYGNHTQTFSVSLKKPLNLTVQDFYDIGDLSDAEIVSMREALQMAGYDGIIVDELEWVSIFDGASASKNDGGSRYSIRDNEQSVESRAAERFGIFGWSGESEFSVPEERISGRLIRVFQDKFKPLKTTQEAIAAADGPLSETENAYMAEEAFHGKTEEDLRQLEEELVKPLVDEMVSQDLTMEELDLYLMAKHARERNDYIASINPEMPDGGSGMTNAEAQRILNLARSEGRIAALESAAERVYAMTRQRRELLRESGLQSDYQADAWEEMYDYYVPLKGFADNEISEQRPRIGSGFDIRGKESMRALGRRSMAASPTTQAIQDLTESIIRNRKNEVGLTFLKLVEGHPNKDYWEVFTNENPDTYQRIVSTAQGDQVRTAPIPMGMMKDDYLAVKRNGQEHFIKIKDPRLMAAMKNLGPEQSNALVKFAGGVTRILSALNTSYNPEFTVSNLSRDIQTALYNALAEQDIAGGKVEGQKLAMKMVKGTPKAIRAIWSSNRNKTLDSDAGRELQEYYQEFLEDGAKTGYFDSKDVDGLASDLSDMISMAQGGAKGNLLKFRKTVGDFVEHGNSAIENGVRLSAYVEARKAGVSRKLAASFSKNLTVNFNRKGEAGPVINSLYMFANASIQGTANFGRAMVNFKEVEESAPIIGRKRLNMAQKLAASMVAGGFILSLFNRWMAGEDDDGESWYDKVPTYVRERNIVIMKPGEEGKFWTIPLPYGYNIFYNLGDTLEAAANSSYQPRREGLVTDMILAGVNSFSPLGAHGGDPEVAMPLTITPTVLLPFVEIATNTNHFGGQIYRENYGFGAEKSDSNMAMRSTKQAYKSVAEWLNEVSGGSEYRSGLIDVSPDSLEHIAEFSLGGLYRLVDRTLDSTAKAINGVDVSVSSIPFRRKLEGQVMPYEDISRFYDARQEIENFQAEIKASRGAERAQLREEYGDKVRLAGRAKQISRRLSALRKRRDAIESDESLSPREQSEKLQEIEDQMKKAVDRFNKDWKY